MRYVTAETMKPMNHLRTINPKVREGVSRFIVLLHFEVYCYVYCLFYVIKSWSTKRSRTELFSHVKHNLMVINL